MSAARQATNYLLKLGHRKIAFIYGHDTSLLTRDRESGYRDAMHKAGIPIRDGWVLEGKMTIDGRSKRPVVYCIHPHRPTAIFCANDEMAMGCIHAIKAAGLRVPEDLSVVGFDDIRYADILDPPLTTVRQPAEEIGRRVMRRYYLRSKRVAARLLKLKSLRTNSSSASLRHHRRKNDPNHE